MRHPEIAIPIVTSRRGFLRAVSLAATTSALSEAQFATAAPQTTANTVSQAVSSLDVKRMRAVAAWTALTMQTPTPVPYGAEIVSTKNGELLMRAVNAVSKENDHSAHAETRTIRLACSKLGSPSLKGYTLYTTCEPCAMCMACALWAGLDRVVYGATIADASRFGHQIHIPAAEVTKRSDMPCVVDGPVERDACLALFTDPKMQETFKRWNSEKP
jgi:tRNA(Arg) A34 adenosine deaminase TadA